MPSDVDDAVEIEVFITARPEVIFSFFTDPQKVVRWMGVNADLEARPGGVFRLNVTGRDLAIGEYLEVAPHSRVVFTWGWEGGPIPPGSSRVEVSLIPDGDQTIVRLRHSGLTVDQREPHREGWQHYLPRLVMVAEGRDPGPDPWAAATEAGG